MRSDKPKDNDSAAPEASNEIAPKEEAPSQKFHTIEEINEQKAAIKKVVASLKISPYAAAVNFRNSLNII
jgi:hypothetical protein